MREFSSFRDIAKQYGVNPNTSETLPVIEFIRRTTLLEGDAVLIPDPRDSAYRVMSLDSFKNNEGLVKTIKDIFKDHQSEPSEVYVLTEEEVDNQAGLTKFSFDSFLKQALPYLYNNMGSWNAWVTDGRTATVTFSTQDYIYSRRVPKVTTS